MADTTKKAVNAEKTEKEYVLIRLPIKKKEDTVFVGVNFKNYLIKRGEWVRVPKEVAEVINNAEDAEMKADAYAQAKETAYLEKAARNKA